VDSPAQPRAGAEESTEGPTLVKYGFRRKYGNTNLIEQGRSESEAFSAAKEYSLKNKNTAIEVVSARGRVVGLYLNGRDVS
jgi:hypothetical protein